MPCFFDQFTDFSDGQSYTGVSCSVINKNFTFRKCKSFGVKLLDDYPAGKDYVRHLSHQFPRLPGLQNIVETPADHFRWIL